MNLKFTIVCLFIIFSTSACRKGIECVDISESDSTPIVEPFDGVQVEVGIDASASMIGFVSDPGTLYSEAIVKQ